MTKVTTELLNAIRERNEKTRAWIAEDPSNRMASILPEDAKYWEESEIYTLDDYKREELINLIWDSYKDAYGTRPRHLDFSEYSTLELEEMADRYCKDANEAYHAQLEEEKANVEAFKKRLSEVISMGAGDVETALRWMTEGETFYNSQDVDHWVWQWGILFTDYGTEMAEKLMEIVEFKDAA